MTNPLFLKRMDIVERDTALKLRDWIYKICVMRREMNSRLRISMRSIKKDRMISAYFNIKGLKIFYAALLKMIIKEMLEKTNKK